MSPGRMRIPSYAYITYIILPTADMLPQTQDIGHKPLLWGLWPMSFLRMSLSSAFIQTGVWGIIQPDKPCGMLLLGFPHTFIYMPSLRYMLPLAFIHVTFVPVIHSLFFFSVL